MQGAFLGPSFHDAEIEQCLKAHDAPYVRLRDAELYNRIAEELAVEKVIGWFQGRMEFGLRALGARSILGDARSPKMQSVMNLKIKYRESCRPFAPSVLRERVADYFALDGDSPYMLLMAPVVEARRLVMTEAQHALWGIELLNVPRSDIPAVTHVDYSARIQTVHSETNPRYCLWMTVGEILGWLNTHIILGVLFSLVFTPMGLCMRLRGKDPMRRTLSPAAESSRVVHQPRPASHMRHQV